MKKISTWLFLTVFCFFSCALHANWEEYKYTTLSHLPEIPGWCPKDKAAKMMDLIYYTHPSVCVEIGVFGGSSIYPTARALKYQGFGVIHAIDPWDNQECTKGYDKNDPNYQWWDKIDLGKIYTDFLKMLRKYEIQNYCHVIKAASAQALSQFNDESIDILHVDGNHSEGSALFDVTAYLPKVKRGGYIWFDDANWSSTHKAVQFLMENCILDASSSPQDPYLLFRKN